MKKLKKLAALVLAAAMVLAMGMTSFAAETGTITINNTGRYAAEGVTFKAYKVFDVTKSGDNYGYTMTALAKAFFAEKGVTTDNAAYEYVNTNPGAGTFRDEMAAYIIRQSTTYTADATVTGTGAMSPAVGYGYYIIVPTKENVLDETISPNLVYVGQENVTVELKGEKPTVEKTVNNLQWTNGNIGDVLNFKLTSKVPDMSSYDPDTYVFKFVDTLSKGLLVDTAEEKIIVKIGGEVYDDVTVTTDPSPATGKGETKLTISLNNLATAADIAVGDAIEVTYSATITDDVAVTKNDATNTVKIEYGNEGETKESGKDTTHTYLYHMEILKTDNTEPANPLPGAVFEIYKANTAGTAVEGDALNLVLESAGSADAPAVYHVADVAQSGITVTTVTTPASGKVIIRGLDEGKYFARETKAPDGYNCLAEDTPVTIDPTTADNGATITYPREENKVTIQNHKGSLLPDTGGMGTVIFTVIGLVLILGVGASFVISRKKRA